MHTCWMRSVDEEYLLQRCLSKKADLPSWYGGKLLFYHRIIIRVERKNAIQKVCWNTVWNIIWTLFLWKKELKRCLLLPQLWTMLFYTPQIYPVFKGSPMLVWKNTCILPVMMVVFVLFSSKLLPLHNSIFTRIVIPEAVKSGELNNWW